VAAVAAAAPAPLGVVAGSVGGAVVSGGSVLPLPKTVSVVSVRGPKIKRRTRSRVVVLVSSSAVRRARVSTAAWSVACSSTDSAPRVRSTMAVS
jgi:hypothetical protein